MSNLPERVTASMRAADVDRMRVAQLLSDAAAQGRLELSEFEQRLAKVYSANTYGELDQLSADLPDVATSPVRGQGSKPAPSTVLMAIMSGFERRGRECSRQAHLIRAVGWWRAGSALRRLHLQRG
ncbi:protein of uncharacterised function (DUF1707) [Mycobacteroides abscessus subsp. bolletii]|nr:protein of uncharacterised function (DUF1707) [Mycobacteroides abscessus subsp. bolletii]SKN88059.1 protein of uncharacterised function (DUF1707) [Mycobacteroides abscessus subsp. bolletii]